MLSPRKQLTPRRNVRLEGRIAYGRTVRPCIVKSVSDTEAKIEVSPVGDVPNTFDLLLPGHRPHHCRIVWRALKEIGVTYQD